MKNRKKHNKVTAETQKVIKWPMLFHGIRDGWSGLNTLRSQPQSERLGGVGGRVL